MKHLKSATVRRPRKLRKYKLPVGMLKSGMYTTSDKYTPILRKYALTTLLDCWKTNLNVEKISIQMFRCGLYSPTIVSPALYGMLRRWWRHTCDKKEDCLHRWRNLPHNTSVLKLDNSTVKPRFNHTCPACYVGGVATSNSGQRMKHSC
jgi:hypothetical protein